MTFNVSKDGLTILCDNESELRIAVAVLNEPPDKQKWYPIGMPPVQPSPF